MSFKIIDRKPIKVAQIKKGTYNSRKHFKSAGMEELKNSISSIGLIQPIIIKQVKNGAYEVIAGNRRLVAYQDLGIEEIECVIIETKSKITEVDINLIENLTREKLSPIEEAHAYMKRWDLMDKKKFQKIEDHTISFALSKEFPKAEKHIYNKICLLKLPEPIQNAIHLKQFNQTFGNEISRLPTEKDMTELYNRIKNPKQKNGWTVAKIKEYVDNFLEEHEEKTTRAKKQLETSLKNVREQLKPIRTKRNEILKDFNKYYKELLKALKEEDQDLVAPNIIEETINNYTKNMKIENEAKWKELNEDVEKVKLRLNSIAALLTQVRELDIDVCPFCESGISLPAIKRREEELNEKLEELQDEQSSLNEYLTVLKTLLQDFNRAKTHLLKQQGEIVGLLHTIAEYRKEIKKVEVK